MMRLMSQKKNVIQNRSGIPASLRLRSLASAVFLASMSMSARGNPEGGQIAAGTAMIEGEGSALVRINQSSDRAIINWRGFSIAENERTEFIQPSAQSMTLNRVTGVDPSAILGSMSATGQIVLVNPNGILFGEGSRIDAAGLVATTHDIDDGNFMSGQPLRFEGGGKPGASVVNQGLVSIRDAGMAAFVAPHVRNSGLIRANLGTVQLSAAQGFTLDFYGDRLISFQLGDEIVDTLTSADGTPLKALVKNDGTIEVAGGEVWLTAEAARDVVNQSISLGGVVRADSVS